MERKPKLYGISEYLMIMHEVEKARLSHQAPEDHRKEEPPPSGSPLPAASVAQNTSETQGASR